MKRRLLIAVVLVAINIACVWGIAEKSNSYSEPQEALFAIDNDLLLIPAYKMSGKALFFFVKDENNLGAVYVHEGFFGWKADLLTWGPMDSARNYDSDHLNGFQKQGENLLYGLMMYDVDRIVQVNEEQAKTYPLFAVKDEEIEMYQLQDLAIWFIESEESLHDGEIKLLDRDNNEVLDKADF